MGITHSSPGTTDWFVATRLGRVPGFEPERKFGANINVGTAEVALSRTGGTAPYMPTTATTIEVLSDSANDTAAGSGIRTVRVEGLDGSFNEVFEVVTLNGVTPVVSTQTFIRVFRCFGVTCGTYGGSAAGTITVRASGGGTTFVTLNTETGQTQTTHYCVPARKTLVLFDVHMTPETAKSVTFRLYSRRNADQVSAPFAPRRLSYAWYGVAGPADFTYYESPFIFPEKTDVWMTAQTSTGSAQCSGEYIYMLVDT